MNLQPLQSAITTIVSNRALAVVFAFGVLAIIQTSQMRSPQSEFGPFINESYFASTYVSDVARN